MEYRDMTEAELNKIVSDNKKEIRENKWLTPLQVQNLMDANDEIAEELSRREKEKLVVTPVLNTPLVADRKPTQRTSMSTSRLFL